jgi:N-glycosylase/DNA lyase
MTRTSLLDQIKQLKRSPIHEVIRQRIAEFSAYRQYANTQLFSELCFCILTANCTAERVIAIQHDIGTDFSSLSQHELSTRLRAHGYRFPTTRAAFICKDQPLCDSLPGLLDSDDQQGLREWLVAHVKGFGYKEASHFLRNVGFDDIAIIDVHILDILVDHNIISRPKTLTRKRYRDIEQILRELAHAAGVTLAELDLYLWYLETGKILK